MHVLARRKDKGKVRKGSVGLEMTGGDQCLYVTDMQGGPSTGLK